jgi:hypothetical protein
MQILLQKKETIIIFIVTLSAIIVKWNLMESAKSVQGAGRSSEGLVVRNVGKDDGTG